MLEIVKDKVVKFEINETNGIGTIVGIALNETPPTGKLVILRILSSNIDKNRYL